MNDEPFAGAEQLMGDHQRPNGVIGGPAAGIANEMGVAFGEPSVFGRIEPCVHAGENRELPGWRQWKLALGSERFRIGLIGGDHLVDDFGHVATPLPKMAGSPSARANDHASSLKSIKLIDKIKFVIDSQRRLRFNALGAKHPP